MLIEMEFFGIALLLLAAGFLFSMLRVLREYERGVIFMLGRFYQVSCPEIGLH